MTHPIRVGIGGWTYEPWRGVFYPDTLTQKKELDQESFLKLLTMQLSYQDPFKPVDNAQMLSQMTSMSTSQGISSLSTQMESLNSLMTSSQALQASALVGQNVLIPSNTGYVEKGGTLTGVIATGDGGSPDDPAADSVSGASGDEGQQQVVAQHLRNRGAGRSPERLDYRHA